MYVCFRLYSSSAAESTMVKKMKFSNDIKPRTSCQDFMEDEDGYVQVYTDGACEKNGKVGAKAGVGVFFGDGHPL